MCKRTLQRVLQTSGCPDHAARFCTLRGFTDEPTRLWNAGEHNGRQLYCQLQSQGYHGSYLAVTCFLEPLRQQKLETAKAIASVCATRTPSRLRHLPGHATADAAVSQPLPGRQPTRRQ
jgi:hypothetical protein